MGFLKANLFNEDQAPNLQKRNNDSNNHSQDNSQGSINR